MGKYDDIKNVPYKKSTEHGWMSRYDRAAQFGAFEALNGHSEALDETARLTDGRIVLGECEAALLNEKLQKLIKNPKQRVRITYFVPDEKKEGGRYVTEQRTVRLVDETQQKVIFDDRFELQTDFIGDVMIEGEEGYDSVEALVERVVEGGKNIPYTPHEGKDANGPGAGVSEGEEGSRCTNETRVDEGGKTPDALLFGLVEQRAVLW